MNNSIDVLNLEWTSYPSRDRNVASLVNNYLRIAGLKVYSGSVYEGYKLINNLKPKLLFITNATGALINFQLVKYANSKGIKIVSLVSEGNYVKENLEQFIWGWNYDKIMYEDIQILWSNRTKDMTISKYPHLKSKIKVSGSAGLDIYKIMPQINKIDFLKKYKKTNYSKIIGIGCWDFGILYPSDHRFKLIKERFSDDTINRFKHDQTVFNEILLKIIQQNPNILFLLKEHPGNIAGLEMSGINKTDNFDNVIILKKESIVDCISISDIWLTYESTTVIEAWMFNKQTGLINPSGVDFPRSNVYKGSPNFPNVDSLQKAIDFFYESNKLENFDNLFQERESVIKEISEWHDGFNHVRIGNEILDIINNKTPSSLKKASFDFKIFIDSLKQKLYPFLPYLKNKSFISRKLNEFNHNDLLVFEEKLMLYQKEFYKKQNKEINKLITYKCI